MNDNTTTETRVSPETSETGPTHTPAPERENKPDQDIYSIDLKLVKPAILKHIRNGTHNVFEFKAIHGGNYHEKHRAWVAIKPDYLDHLDWNPISNLELFQQCMESLKRDKTQSEAIVMNTLLMLILENHPVWSYRIETLAGIPSYRRSKATIIDIPMQTKIGTVFILIDQDKKAEDDNIVHLPSAQNKTHQPS